MFDPQFCQNAAMKKKNLKLDYLGLKSMNIAKMKFMK